jgi:glycosyltransferase involved in cell wall biosynthesis
LGEIISKGNSRAGRILFLTTVLPGALASGGEIVTSRFIQALRRLTYEVTVLGYCRRGYTPIRGEKLVKVRPIETQRAPAHVLYWTFAAFPKGRALSVQKYIGRAYRARLFRELQATQWDAVVVDHAQMAWTLPYLSGQNCIHICHNNEASLYELRATSSSGLSRWVLLREAAIMRNLESALARSCVAVWTITSDDAQYFRSLGACRTTFLPVPGLALSGELCARPSTVDVVLLGTWTWAPNRAGLDWFCQKILPLLPSSMKIAIGGSGADDLRNLYPNVHIVGRVQNGPEFLASARCIAIPSTQGAGIEIKTLNAIALGRPVVATTLALRGIDNPPQRLHVANNAGDFARALIDLANKPLGTENDSWAFDRETRFLTILKDSLSILTERSTS